jgi:hypothetical protein
MDGNMTGSAAYIRGCLEQSEGYMKTSQEIHTQITDRIAIDHEIQKMLKEIMENPKK